LVNLTSLDVNKNYLTELSRERIQNILKINNICIDKNISIKQYIKYLGNNIEFLNLKNWKLKNIPYDMSNKY